MQSHAQEVADKLEKTPGVITAKAEPKSHLTEISVNYRTNEVALRDLIFQV